MTYKTKSKNAFTLAEVLITLVIIGVVAALTIPTAISNYRKQQYVSGLKKAYSSLSQTTNRIIAEEGSPRNWVTTPGNVYNTYKKYLSYAKDCNTDSGCLSANHIYKYLSGGSHNYDTNSYRKLVLADGTILIFEHSQWVSSNCNLTQSWVGSNNLCTYFNVDINGVKEPNTIGRDFFLFVIKENGLYPAGCDFAGSSGLNLACKVLRENAMNY